MGGLADADNKGTEFFCHLEVGAELPDPGLQIRLGGCSLDHFEAGQAVHHNVDGTLRHFYNFQDRRCGADGVEVVEAGFVVFGIALREESYDGFVGCGIGKEGLASLAADCQRRYGSGKGDGVSNRQDTDYIGQF